MKALALMVFVALLAVFAGYHAYFPGQVFYELYGPHARWCGTAQVRALQGAAMGSAPPALPRSVGLWFVGRRRDAVGARFSRASKVSAESVRKQKQEKPL